MDSKRIIWIGILAAAVMVGGCETIHEPWVDGPQQLKQERTRTEAAAQDLRHRLLAMQTDR